MIEGISQNATIRQEYVKCSNLDCKEIHKPHGPYLYAYWKDKETKKLKKKYIGKSLEDYDHKLATQEVNKITGADMTTTQTKKLTFLVDQAKNKHNELAQEYIKKLDTKQNRSIDWAYKQVVDRIREHRTLKMVMLARRSNFEYDGPNELVGFVADQMQSKGLDPTNIEAFDGYLNSEFM